jgi:hypothetical protein
MPRAITAGLLPPMSHPPSSDGEGTMPGDPIESLEWNLWCDSLQGLLRQYARGAPLESYLRLAYHLAVLAPSPASQLVRVRCDEQLFETLLVEAEYEAAVMCLLGPAVSFELTHRPQSNDVVARVWLAEFPEGRGTARSTAPALLTAWLEFLASLRPPRAPLSPGNRSRGRNRLQSERHRKPSSH